MQSIIYYSIMLIIAIVCFLVGKYITPQIPKETIDTIQDWAKKFVVWAQQFLKEESGPEKMDIVVSKLSEIAKANKLNLTEDQIRAIAQFAYEEVKGTIIKKD